MPRHKHVHVQVGGCPRDEREQGHAPDRGAPNPTAAAPGSPGAPSTSSPVIIGIYVTGDSPLGH